MRPYKVFPSPVVARMLLVSPPELAYAPAGGKAAATNQVPDP